MILLFWLERIWLLLEGALYLSHTNYFPPPTLLSGQRREEGVVRTCLAILIALYLVWCVCVCTLFCC